MEVDDFCLHSIVSKLDNLERQTALYEERVHFLSRLLLQQEALLRKAEEAKFVYETSLLRMTQAEVLYGSGT